MPLDERAPTMVFHAPFPVVNGATSASGIRPWKMLQAFRSLGYDVFQITGYASERKRRFAQLRRRFDAGWRPNFVYSEAATIPSSFTEPNHFPLVLTLDRKIFRFLHRYHVPSGVFYRDVYWAFKDYERRVGKPVAIAMRKLYLRELVTFNRYVDVLFLPSLQMGSYVPGIERMIQIALPPGSDTLPSFTAIDQSSAAPLRLLYVGAVGGEHYDISALLSAVRTLRDVELTICTRPEQWESASNEYEDLLCDSVSVVHESGNGLASLYQQADIACLMMKPQEYRSFAAPMKLYEYLGHGVPVLASSRTLAGEVINENGAGWVTNFDADKIADQLEHLKHSRGELTKASEAAQRAGERNSWNQRAQFVSDTLTGLGPKQGKTKRHVLVIPSWYPLGPDDPHGSFFREQAEALIRDGNEVGVLSLTASPVYQLGSGSEMPCSSGIENGVNVVRRHYTHYLPMQREANIWLARVQIERAWDEYVKTFGKPDVLHAHSLYPGAYIAAQISKAHGVPYVYTEHRSLEHLRTRTLIGKRNELNVVAGASSRIAVSRGHARHLAHRFGRQAGSWGVIYNLLPAPGQSDQTRFDASEQGSGSDEFTYGHLSFLGQGKRVDLLLEAFADVVRRDTGAKLVIGGDGLGRVKLEELAVTLGIERDIEFRGLVPRSDTPAFFAQLDAFVLPSDSETMGVALIEALAQGLPVIATRTWGGEDIAVGEDGILVDIGDKRQLADAMIEIRGWSRDAKTRLNRINRCIEKYGEETFVSRYAQIYQRAIEGK